MNANIISSLWLNYLDERLAPSTSIPELDVVSEPHIPEPGSFEDLTDDQIEEAIRSTKHLYAREVRAGRA